MNRLSKRKKSFVFILSDADKWYFMLHLHKTQPVDKTFNKNKKPCIMDSKILYKRKCLYGDKLGI